MTRTRRLLTGIAASTLALGSFPGLLVASTPDESGIVVRFDDWFASGYRDAEDDLVALAGPPAELWCQDLGFEEFITEFQLTRTPHGAVIANVRGADLPIWIYRASRFAEVCDVVLAGATPELLAWGTARFTSGDNDLFVTETRMNAFGSSASGNVADADGQEYSFSAVLRAQVAPSEGDECLCRVMHEDITLRRRG